jgi:hypothetical protein
MVVVVMVVVVLVHILISASGCYGATNSTDPLGTSLAD